MKRSIILMMAVATATLTGCSALVKYEIKDGNARVENYVRNNKITVQNHIEWKENNYDEDTHPYTKETLKYLYVMCNNNAPRPFRLAYQHPAGQHKLWVKAIFEAMEADALFEVELKPGGDYGFGHKMYKNRRQVDIWIEDRKTGERYSETQVITLKRAKIEYEKSAELWDRRCKMGSV